MIPDEESEGSVKRELSAVMSANRGADVGALASAVETESEAAEESGRREMAAIRAARGFGGGTDASLGEDSGSTVEGFDLRAAIKADRGSEGGAVEDVL